MKFLRASVITLLCCLAFLHFSALSNILQVFAMRPAAARQQTDYFRFISKSRTCTHTHLNIQSTGTPDTQPRFFENIFFVWGKRWMINFLFVWTFFTWLSFWTFSSRFFFLSTCICWGTPVFQQTKSCFFWSLKFLLGGLYNKNPGEIARETRLGSSKL